MNVKLSSVVCCRGITSLYQNQQWISTYSCLSVLHKLQVLKTWKKPVIFQIYFTQFAYSFLPYSVSFLKHNWNSLGSKWLVTTKNVELDFWQTGYFCSLPRPAQHSSNWLLRHVCAVVKWQNMKLALAFVLCRVLACGEIYLLLTPCSIRELFVAFYFVAVIFFILGVLISQFHFLFPSSLIVYLNYVSI
jgi:hypothetical protein